jgi:hypothetical protein
VSREKLKGGIMSGSIRDLISFYVTSPSNAYYDASPAKIEGEEGGLIASSMFDSGINWKIKLDCWKAIHKYKNAIFRELVRSGLPPQDCPAKAVDEYPVYADHVYTNEELEILATTLRYAEAIFDALISIDEDVSEAPAAVASIIARDILPAFNQYNKWPFELVFVRSRITGGDGMRLWGKLLPLIVRSSEELCKELGLHNVTVPPLPVIRESTMEEKLLVLLLLGGDEWLYGMEEDSGAGDRILRSFQGNPAQATEWVESLRKMFHDTIAEFIKNRANLEPVWQFVNEFELPTVSRTLLGGGAPKTSEEGVIFSIEIDNEFLGLEEMCSFLINLSTYLESYGFTQLEIDDIGTGSLWVKLKGFLAGNPDDRDAVLEEAVGTISEAVKAKYVEAPKAENTKTLAESTRLEAEAMLKVAEAERIRRSPGMELAQETETLAKAAKLIAEAEETRAKAQLLKAQAAQIREETALNKAMRLKLIKSEIVDQIGNFDKVVISDRKGKRLLEYKKENREPGEEPSVKS